MGSIYDQFVQQPDTPAPAANPYAQFVTPQPPQSQGGIGAQIMDALTAGGHHLMKPLNGASQLVNHALGDVTQYLPDAVNKPVQQMISAQDARLKQNEADYQATQRNSLGTDVGAVAGEVLPYVVGGVPRGLAGLGESAASVLPDITPALLKRIVSGGAQGAAVSATQPVTSGNYADKGGDMLAGAAAGGALPVAGSALNNIIDLGQHVLMPKAIAAKMLAQNVGSDPATLNALDNAVSFVPGETPTAAQVAANPSAVAAEKALGNTPQGKLALVGVQNDNNAARLAALQQVAGTPEALQQAYAARSASVQPFITQYLSGGNGVDPTDILSAIAKTQNSSLGMNPFVKKALGSISGQIQDNTQDGQIGADLLDGIRQNANRYLDQGAGAQERRGLVPLTNQITSTLDASIPGYRDYLATYAKGSQPINDMETAQQLLDTAGQRAANSVGDTNLSLAQINSAINRDANAQHGLSPQAQAQFKAIQDSLRRQSISNSIGSPGSDTQYNQASALTNSLLGGGNGPSGKAKGLAVALGAYLGGHLGGVEGATIGAGTGAGLSTAANAINQRIMSAYTKGLLDPQTAAAMIRSQQQSQAPSTMMSLFPQLQTLTGN